MKELVDGATTGAATSISALVERTFNAVFSSAGANIGAMKTMFVVGFSEYLSLAAARISKVKTLISRDEPVDINIGYEPSFLTIGSREISIDQLIIQIADRVVRNVLITATLGSGKSLTTKYIFLKLCKSSEGCIPIYIELRDVDFSKGGIVEAVEKLLSPHIKFLGKEAVVAGLKAGVFILILDGYDEVAPALKGAAQRDIHDVSESYPLTRIIVSSRPDARRFISWHSFPEYAIAPLSLGDLRSLIKRIKYDEDEKAAFLDRLDNALFYSHREVLENPLLANMMLLTFRRFRNIPVKMHVFFDTAFDVMYREHDAVKMGYDRKFEADLVQEDFKRLFMCFCFLSFVDGAYSFSQSDFIKYMNMAVEYEELPANSFSVMRDIVNNVCVMIKEGDQFLFIHRSFQEYFCALFLVRREFEGMEALLNNLLVRPGGGQEVIEMAYDIEKEAFEKKYLLDRAKSLIRDLDAAESIQQKCSVLGSAITFADTLEIGRSSDGVSEPIVEFVRDGEVSPHPVFLKFLQRHYGTVVDYKAHWARDDWRRYLARVARDPGQVTLPVAGLGNRIEAELAEAFGLAKYVAAMESSATECMSRLDRGLTGKQSIINKIVKKPPPPRE